MDNKKIPTKVGVIVIVIIAVTVFGVVWKWEKMWKMNIEIPVVVTVPRVIKNNQGQGEQKNQTGNINEKSVNVSDWKKYSDARISFSYPEKYKLGTGSDDSTIKDPNMYFFDNVNGEKNQFQILLYNGLGKEYVENRINLPTTTKINEINLSSGERIIILNILDKTTKNNKFLSFVSRQNSEISLEVYGPMSTASSEEVTAYNEFLKSIRIK